MTRKLSTALFFVVALLPAMASAVDREPQSTCTSTFKTPTQIAAAPLIIFGEIHGTNQAPALIAHFACQALVTGQRVGVGLEIPSSEQALIDRYLESVGAPADRAALLAGPFWQSKFQDGRSSEAMANLIESLRRLKKENPAIHIVAMDGGLPGLKRDASMAQTLKLAMKSSASDKWFVLIGNVHAAKISLNTYLPHYKPFAFHLAEEQAFTVSIEFGSGTAWNCRPTCGVSAFSNKESFGPSGFQLGGARSPGFDAAFRIDSATASPPALGLVTAD